MKKSLFLPPLLALTLITSSCANYSASPLTSLSSDLIFSQDSGDEALVVSKAFTKNDCSQFLDRDVLEEGYQPVQIFIQNNSDKTYLFSLNRISLPIARSEEVAEKVHTSTVARVVSYGVGALFLWPLAIPAIVDGIKSSDANKALDRDFFMKTAKDQMIFPHSKMNALLFFPKDAYQDHFTITLIDQKTKEPKTFQVVPIVD